MIHIRIAQPEDTESIVEFNMAMALETEQKELDRDVLTNGVQAVFKDQSYGFYVVAEADNKPIGSLLVTSEWSDWRNGLFWWIQSLYVLPEWRRQGVFRSLHAFVTERARQNGSIHGLRLCVETNNTPARACYEDRGMTPSIYTLYEQALE
ncbi:MAG: GNAT family N-acetyltransferase [Planctomycetota bacterium]